METIYTSNLQERIEIFISCRKLQNMELFGKSEPKVQFYTLTQKGTWEFYEETEQIKNTANPDFAKSFQIDYDFEHKQMVRFHIGDVNRTGGFDLVGDVETSISQLMGAKNQTSIFDVMRGGRPHGKLIVRCESIKQCNEWLYLEAEGYRIASVGGCMGCGAINNPFLNLYRSEPDGSFAKVWETESYNNNANPVWKGFEMSVQHLVNGDHKRPIRMTVHSRNNDNEMYVGECKFTLDDLLLQQKSKFDIVSAQTNKIKGAVSIKKAVINVKPTFIDYIRGGVQLHTILAIDFTASNGNPSEHHSLHTIRPNHRNHYLKAIDGVMDVLIHYDWDRRIPMYGFGAVLNFPGLKSLDVVHCFPCTGNPLNPYANGLFEIDATYINCLAQVKLSGPTHFAPILREAMKVVQEKKARGSVEYSILVIFTDGQINDMQPTTDALVESAFLPLSVIIIGIGHSEFENMHVLDGERGTLRHSNGQLDQREICQFVPFARFNHDHTALARHVLEKIPNQLTSYYRLMNIQPNPPQSVNLNNINLTQVVNVAVDAAKQFQTLTSLGFMNQPNQMQLNAFQGASNGIPLGQQNLMQGNNMNNAIMNNGAGANNFGPVNNYMGMANNNGGGVVGNNVPIGNNNTTVLNGGVGMANNFGDPSNNGTNNRA